MPVNEMFAKILSDYQNANSHDSCAAEVLQVFCEYATKWLDDACLVGVGHTTNGVSLRFADGSEYLLTEAPSSEVTVANMPAFSITGNNGGSVRSAGAIQDSSIRIVGNS
jgi:hypothetical protein